MKKNYLLISAIILTCGTAVHAENFNVSTPAEFRTALTTAAANGEADVINVAPGIYSINAVLQFYSEENFSLSIYGDGAGSSILDGANANKLISLETTGPDADITISGFGFENGHDDYGAVSINLDGADFMMTACNFSANTADEFGGAMTVYVNSGTATVETCIFEENQAIGNDAGALYIGTNNGEMTLRNSIFQNNEAMGDDAGGSMLYSDAGGTAIMSGNTYIGNTAAEDAGGAMVYLLGANSEARIYENQFSSNYAYLGGGGCWIRLPGGGEIIYEQNQHIGNTTDVGGGAGLLIELQIEGDLSISDNLFEGNEAGLNNSEIGDGGGCWIEHGAGFISIHNNDFFDNFAYHNGGAVSLYTDSGNLDFFRNRIANNEAGNVGGGLSYATTSGIPYDYNNSFYGNIAGADGGAIYFYMDQAPSVLYLYNSIYRQNLPNAFVYDGPNAIMAMYCDIEGGSGQSWFGNGCIDTDPLFQDPANNNLLLSWANYPVNDDTKSPCIDTGDPSFPPDPDGSDPDMGALPWAGGLSIYDQNKIHSVNIYPNPAQNTLAVEVEIHGQYIIEVYDAAGLCHIQKEVDDVKATLDISGLVPGTYSLRISGADNAVITRQFIKY